MQRLIPPPFYLLAGLAAQQLIAHGERSTRASLALGGAVQAASVALAADASRRFVAAGTTYLPERPERASALVAEGPYRFTRNPMYVGLTGALLGRAIQLRSPASLLPVAAFWLVIDRVQVRAEEAALLRVLGEPYADFCRRVPRWGPRPGRSARSGAH